ncbi:MAG: glycosyltransferase family 25 protein, partial [Pseudomonadota bacterium]
MSIASLTTYLINLDTSIERRLSAEQYLKSAGLEFTRVPAFDGRGANPKDFAEYDHHRARGWFGRGLSGAELGCYFSHVACVRRFLQSDAAFGLVLEDDLALEPSAADILRSSLDFLET